MNVMLMIGPFLKVASTAEWIASGIAGTKEYVIPSTLYRCLACTNPTLLHQRQWKDIRHKYVEGGEDEE